MKIVCIGHAAYDVTLPVSRFPVENTKNRIDKIIECGGGPASNAAYLLGMWGADTTFLGMVGDDINGHAIRKELEKAGVSTDYLEINTHYRTPIGHVIVNESSGTRTVLTYRESKEMKLVDLSFAPDFILMDGQEYQMSKKLLRDFPKAISIMDASRVTDEILELSSLCTYLICSKDFAEQVAGVSFDLEDREKVDALYHILEERFQTSVMVTLEEKGTLYKDKDILSIYPSISVNPVDSTGAGDFFHGAFVYALSKGYPIKEAIFLSNVAGALSTRKMGSRNSVPTKKEMREYVDDFR